MKIHERCFLDHAGLPKTRRRSFVGGCQILEGVREVGQLGRSPLGQAEVPWIGRRRRGGQVCADEGRRGPVCP